MKACLLLLFVVIPCLGADTASTVPEAAAASGPVTLCENMPREPGVAAECQKRETARWFLIAGKPDVALRILCDTETARTAFGDDYEAEHHQWIHPAVPTKCLQAVGISPK